MFLTFARNIDQLIAHPGSMDHGLNAQTTMSHGDIALLVLTELSLTLSHVNIVLYIDSHVRAVSCHRRGRQT